MPMPPRRLALLAACALAPLSAFAQTPAAPAPAAPAPTAPATSGPTATPAAPSAAQAAVMQAAIHNWLAGLFGTFIKFPTDPVTVTPDGDHYRLAVDFSHLPGVSGNLTTTAAARPLDGGRWALDHVQTTQPIQFRIDMPATKDHPAGPLDVTAKIASQDTSAVIDPSFATPLTSSSKLGGYDIVMAGPGFHQIQHLDGATSAMSIVPNAATGRLDVTQEVTGQNFSSTRTDPGIDPFEIAAQKLAMSGHLDGIDRQRGVVALQTLFTVAGSAALQKQAAQAAQAAQSAPGGGAAAAAASAAVPDKATLRTLYLAWRGLATGGAFQESLDQLRVVAAGHQVGMNHVAMGGAVATPGGMLSAQLSFALDGLQSTDIPPIFADYVPRHIAVQPSISAIDLADLDALILALIAPGDQHPDVDQLIAALFAHGGIVAGIDTLELDVGPAHLAGTGKLTALRPDMLRGDAELSMTGFDALADKINAEPAFAAAVPVITMARGLGRQQGDRIVWQISTENEDVKVNGTDLTALLGQSKQDHSQHSQPGQTPRPRRQRP